MATPRRLFARVSFRLASAALALALPASAMALSSYEEVKLATQASDVLVLDRSGQVLERVRFDFQARRGDWIALEDISIAFQRAVLLSEDRRFYTHGGVDWRAIAAAAWDTLAHERHRGASTLSMQLLGLMEERFQRGPQGRGIMQKIDQAIEARRLEDQWSKSQILEAYLNLAAFRGELIGVDAVSRVLFRKHPSGLDARESALAAALLRGPNASAAVVARRACALLIDMGEPDDCTGLAAYAHHVLARKSGVWADRAGMAAHYARLALAKSHSGAAASQTVRTTLDAGLQRYAVESIARHLRVLGMDNVRDAAVVVLDNRSGQILAYVGSSGDLSSAARVDHARALRQAGSTLKPFLYAQAIEQQRLTMASLLNDSPLDIPTGNGLYIPQNYDKRFSGWVSARTALASSLNIPALRVLLMISPDAFARRLVSLGLPLDQSGDFYGYSLALGSADVTLLTLTNAYRALAAGGLYSPPRYLLDEPGAPPPQRVMSEAAAWIVGDVLSDRQARSRTFGFDSPLSTPFWTAVKTGTSKDMRDNWCMGWSQDYTVGVWVGNSGGDSMRDVSGVSGAGPVWHDVMSYLHRHRPSMHAARPAQVSQVQVVFENDLEPARTEAFTGDTILRRVQLAQDFMPDDQKAARIAAPADGSIFAIDPDIPPDHQRSALRAKNVAAAMAKDVAWRIDGSEVGRGGEVAWAPWPGRHRIELLDAQGKVLDAVHVEVRAAAPR
jgi:penicillin-binding protein 1C